MTIITGEKTGRWLMGIFSRFIPGDHELLTFQEMEERYIAFGLGDFKTFWDGSVVRSLQENGMVIV